MKSKRKRFHWLKGPSPLPSALLLLVCLCAQFAGSVFLQAAEELDIDRYRQGERVPIHLSGFESTTLGALKFDLEIQGFESATKEEAMFSLAGSQRGNEVRVRLADARRRRERRTDRQARVVHLREGARAPPTTLSHPNPPPRLRRAASTRSSTSRRRCSARPARPPSSRASAPGCGRAGSPSSSRAAAATTSATRSSSRPTCSPRCASCSPGCRATAWRWRALDDGRETNT